MAFPTLESNLPEDLVDSIARTVHRYNMDQVVPCIRSVMRCMLSEGAATFIDKLRETYPGLKVYKDNYLYWFTAVVFLDEANVIIFHSYFDDPMHSEVAIAEATIDNDEIVVRNVSAVSADYFEQNTLPLSFLYEVLEKRLTVKTAKIVHPVEVDDWVLLEEGFRTM